MHNVLLRQAQKRSNLVISSYIVFYLLSLLHSLSLSTLFFSVQDESSYHAVSTHWFALEKFPP